MTLRANCDVAFVVLLSTLNSSIISIVIAGG